MNKLTKIIIVCIAIFTGSISQYALADIFPGKPIRLIVPFGPGGPTDVMARIFSGEMAKYLGQPVIVENKPGANGNIALDYVIRSPADGYVIVLATAATIIINPLLSTSLSYNPLVALVPVAQFTQVPNILVVSPNFPAKNFSEFIKIVKSNEKNFNYGSGGKGTTAHLQGEILKTNMGLKADHIPYKGEAPALIDLMGGQIDFVFVGMASANSQIQAGKVRPLAIASSSRSAKLNTVPTFTELGLKGLELSAWYGIMAPKGTPTDVILKLNNAVHEAFKSPDLTSRLDDLGAIPFDLTPTEFSIFLQTENSKWSPIVKQSGLKAD